jgi:hypothetical protein
MKQNEVLYLASERWMIYPADLAANPGLVLVTEEHFSGVAPTVEAIVQAMVSKVNATGQIKLLSVQCHGYAGGLVLWGGGLKSEDATQCTPNTNPGTTRKLLEIVNVFKMASFADCMHPQGSCELHACNVSAARGPEGFWCSPASPTGVGDDAVLPRRDTCAQGPSFLQALANILKVNVTAGARVQSKMVGFDGPTFTASPKCM